MGLKKEDLSPKDFTVKTGSYSHGLSVSDGRTKWIFVTGQIAMDANGNVVSPGNIVGQAEFIFENIQKILVEAGASLDNVVKAQLFLTDMSLFSQVSSVRNKYFAKSQPVSTLVEVSKLVKEGCMLEIEVIAIKEDQK
jgi:reactive intermediate/imine deaminase